MDLCKRTAEFLNYVMELLGSIRLPYVHPQPCVLGHISHSTGQQSGHNCCPSIGNHQSHPLPPIVTGCVDG